MEEELIPSEMIFKIIIIGDLSSGKTNIISRYISNKFIQDSQPTIGVEMFSKEFKINEDTVIAQIWDTAGQEKYYTLTSSYYKGAKGALIVYDVSQRNTFLKVEKFVNDLKENCDKRVYTILVGNKIDLEENRTVSTEEGKNLANKLKMGFYEVSAKDGTGINNLFQKIVNEVYDKNNREFKSMASIEIMDSKDEKRFSLGGNNNGESKKKKCC